MTSFHFLRQLPGRALPLVVLLLGLVLSACLALVLQHNATQDWHKRAEQEAARRSMTLLGWIEESYATLSGLVALVENSSNVDSGEFLNSVDGLEARTKVNFMPAKAMMELVAGQWTTKFSSAPPAADPIFPTPGVTPHAQLLKTLASAQNTPNEWFLSMPFADKSGKQFVYVALVPASRTEFALVGVLGLHNMAQTLLDTDGSEDLTLEIKLQAQNDSANEKIIVAKAGALDRHHSSTLTQTAHVNLELAWQFGDSFDGGIDHRLAWSVGGACGLVSVLLALFVWGLRRQGQRIEQRVKEATAELADALKTAEDEAVAKTQVSTLLLSLQRVGNYPELAETLLPGLATLLKLGQASLYRADGQSQQLMLCGAYARHGSLSPVDHIAFGSGLAGQCALEQRNMHVTAPPTDYITIRSGLGSAVPAAIVLVPIVSTGTLLGVLELACLKSFGDADQHLVDHLLPMIAMSMEVISRNESARDLLRSTQEQAAALEIQRREISQLLLEQETIFQNAPHGIVYTADGIMLRANKRFADYFETTVEALVGQRSESIYASKEDFRHFATLVGPQLAAGMDIHLEWECFTKTGKSFFAMVSGQSIQLSGHATATVWMFEDISARKRAEQAVNEAKQTLEIALTSAKMGAWKYYPLESRLEADAATLRLYGLEGVTMDGSLAQWFTYVDPQDAQNVAAVMKETMAKRFAEYRIQFRVVKPDHETVHIMSIGRFTYDKSGQAVLATGLVWDISDIKRAEAATLEERARLQSILDQSPICISITALDGEVLFANPVAKRLFGLEVGQKAQSVYVDPKRRDELLLAIKTRGLVTDFEVDIYDPERRVHTMSLTAMLTHFAERPSLLVWQIDMTERKAGEERLRFVNFLSDQALDLTRAGHWHIPLNTGDEFYNSSERAAAIFGDPPRPDWRYHLMNEWFANVEAGDKDAAARTFENYGAALAGTVPRYDSTYAYQRPVDGRIVWIHAMGHVVRDASGTPTDMYGVTVDVTAAKQAEAELKARMEELERFNHLTIDREEKMIELKSEINALLVQVGRDPKYRIVF